MRVIKRLFFWRWIKRLQCHDTIDPCQYVDGPNDNHSEAP